MRAENKKGAMEMTVGTIVTIVLLMSALVLGLILTKNVFKSSQGAMDLTDQQLMNEIGKVFGSEDEVIAIYPNSKELEIKVGEQGAIGLGIKNLGKPSSVKAFNYIVKVGQSKCGTADVSKWIYLGEKGSGIGISIGDTYVTKIKFEIPEGSPVCTVRYKVEVTPSPQTSPATIYNAEFDITTKA